MRYLHLKKTYRWILQRLIPYTRIVLDFNMRAGSRKIIRSFGSPNVGVMEHLGYSSLCFENKKPLGYPDLYLLITGPCSSSVDQRCI